MFNFWTGVVVSAIGTSAVWWIYLRSFSGVRSDLTDVVNDAKKVVGK